MKKSILPILVIFVLWAPGIIYAQDARGGGVMRATPTNETSEEPSLDYGSSAYLFSPNTKSQDPSKLPPREWHIVEKIPTGKGLAIGVFLFEEGMSIEHIQSKFGKPQEIIPLDVEEGYHGTIWVYPNHHFFFSKTGNLQTIKERKR